MKKNDKANIRFNKKRNSALVHEFLIAHISKCLVENNKQEAQKALDISKKFFTDGMPLKSELNLFNSVISNKNISRESLNKIVDCACKSAALMNPKILDEQKSKLIKEINYTLGDKIYDYRVPEYLNLSSLQFLFNESRSKDKKINEIEKIKMQDLLLTRLTEKKQIKEIKFDSSHTNTVYKLLVNKFHEKYSSSLTENQKKFLISYTAHMISENKKQFDDFLTKQYSKITESLSKIKDKDILANKQVMISIKECLEKFKHINLKENSDKVVLEFLQFIALVDELES